MFIEIAIPILIFMGLGLLSGILLTIFSKLFAVKIDERVANIRDVLPGLNCGVCGFSGCDSYAQNVVAGTPTNKCIPGGDDTSKMISSILGSEYQDVKEEVAFVRCGGTIPEATEEKYIYTGERSCLACSKLYGGKGKCTYSCMGFGDCANVCEFGAISIIDGIAVINSKKCVGCSMCVVACPKNIIELKDAQKTVSVKCSSCDNGKISNSNCKNSCIACKKCEKVCPTDAITVTNNIAHIDYDKCTSCGLCAENCPKKCIEVR